MRFWDSSVFVALVVTEEGSPLVETWLSETGETWAWTLTAVEVVSALERRSREKLLKAKDLETARRALLEAWKGVSVVHDVERVKERAMRLLAMHPLRAADACQLAAALVATDERPRDHGFYCFDRRLADAAGREGFTVHGLDA